MVCIRHTVGDADRSRCRRPRHCLSHLHPLIRGRFKGVADLVGSGNLPPPLTFSGPSRTHDTVVFHWWCHFSVTQQNRQTWTEFDQHYSGTDRTTLPIYSFPDFCTFKADPRTIEIPHIWHKHNQHPTPSVLVYLMWPQTYRDTLSIFDFNIYFPNLPEPTATDAEAVSIIKVSVSNDNSSFLLLLGQGNGEKIE